MSLTVLAVAVTLIVLHLVLPRQAAWTPLEPLTGDGAIGSPGGTHPFAVDGDTVHFVWAQGVTIRYRRSDDAGVTWGRSTPITEGGSSEYPVSLELTDGALHLVWPKNHGGGWKLHHNRSVDGGDTWGDETTLTDGDLFRSAGHSPVLGTHFPLASLIRPASQSF